jgi:hypothetical protein
MNSHRPLPPLQYNGRNLGRGVGELAPAISYSRIHGALVSASLDVEGVCLPVTLATRRREPFFKTNRLCTEHT